MAVIYWKDDNYTPGKPDGREALRDWALAEFGKPYRVHLGWTRRGRNRWRKFDTLQAARDFCNAEQARTGRILSITQ